MNKNDLKVYDYVVNIKHPNLLGQIQYGPWNNIDLGITKMQYGPYILWYDNDKWFRIGFDNTNFDYIERSNKIFSTMPQS